MASRAASHRSWAVDIKHGQNEGKNTGDSTPRADIAQTAPSRAVSHRSWAVDTKHGQNEGQKTQETAPHGQDEPKRRTNGHAKRHGGGSGRKPGASQWTWGHLIRKPAKLTGPRRRASYVHGGWGEPTRPGVGSLSRKRYTQCVEHNRKGHCGNKSKNRKGTNNE
jgi:hypothetical protein